MEIAMGESAYLWLTPRSAFRLCKEVIVLNAAGTSAGSALAVSPPLSFDPADR
jgi:hypothetical protein